VDQPAKRSYRSEIELLSVVLFWGLNFVIVKVVLEVMHPHVMNFFRLTVAAAVLTWIYWRRVGGSTEAFWKPLKTDPGAIIRLTIVGWVLYQAAFITGLDKTSAGNGAIIMSSAPIWTALLSLTMGTEKLSAKAWFGLLVSITGTVTVVAFGTKELSMSSDLLIGNAIVLVAAILWGSYTALTKPLVERHSPLSLTVLALLLCLIPLALLSVPFWAGTDWSRVTIGYWLAIVFSGALSTGVAIVFWNNAVRALGASHTAAFGNLVPLIALFSGFLILGDSILPAQLIGGTLIIGGLVIMRWARKRKMAVPPAC
jgi:drug/metabolite transporter (DMT)-like permease